MAKRRMNPSLCGSHWKDEDNTITEEDFAQLSLRFLRIFLPGLTQEEEKHLCQNCWQEAAAGRRRLSFLGFFPYLVRLVQSWTDSSDPNDYVQFLQNLLDRCTCFQVAGQEQPVFPKRLVTFRAAQRGDDLGDGFNDFMESVELVCSGSLEEVQVELQFEVQHGINFHSCFFEEHFEAPAEPCRRVWMDLGRVWPLGYASLVAIRSLRDEPPMTLNCSHKKADLLQSALETLKSQASEAQAVCQISEEGKVLVSQGEFAPRLFSAVVNEGMISGSFVLKPNRGSFMLKLSDLRKQLLLPQSNARWAAESMGSCKPQQCLPSFPDLLSGAVVIDPSSALAKPPEMESLLDSGSLRSIADMYMVSKILRLPAMENALEEPLPPELPEAIYEDFTRHFPTGDEDLLDLARTSPLVLWVFGQCDSSGDYKTEVCRRLAEKMQLQWLQPNYVLELVTKTPSKFRSPLQQRCVQQLQRGMVVSLKDALRLTMEMMSSALCKTNGSGSQ